jgi:hypothetical protein
MSRRAPCTPCLGSRHGQCWLDPCGCTAAWHETYRGQPWRLAGYDAFDGTACPVGGQTDGLPAVYTSYRDARMGAQLRLAYLEHARPFVGSSGQAPGGIRMLIIHPDRGREPAHPGNAARLLYHLGRSPGSVIGDLSRAAGVTRARAIQILRHAEALGFVIRAPRSAAKRYPETYTLTRPLHPGG